MFLTTILAGAGLGEIVGGLIVTTASLTGAAATATVATSTAVGLAGGAAVAVHESEMV